MADLAGFDVIGEIHIETVVDLLNLRQIPNPADGSTFYLLGGPFSTDLPVGLGPLGPATVRIVASTTLQPVLHQPLVHLLISVSGGSTVVAGQPLRHIGGQVSVDVPLAFALPPVGGTTAAGLQTPVALIGATNPVCVLDAGTRVAADQVLGAGGADELTVALAAAIGSLLGQAGPMAIPAMGFFVAPGIDSTSAIQLSAVPVVAWIDGATLGVFGYYRADASGGNLTAKTTGDLHQDQEEFFYGLGGVISVLPGRRAAVLMSAQAVHSVLVCPAIHDYVAAGLLKISEQMRFRVTVRDRDGASELAAQSAAHLNAYLLDEYANGGFDDPATAIARARARVQADVDAVLDKRADDEETAWLASATGRAAVDGAVPPPCGRGSAQLERKPVDVAIAQSDLVATLRFLDVILGLGQIAVHAYADASLELSTGDVSAAASIDANAVVSVTDGGRVQVDITPAVPDVQVSGTGLTGGVLALLQTSLTAGACQSLLAYVALLLQEALVAMLADSLSSSGARRFGTDVGVGVPSFMPQVPLATRVVEVNVEPDSVRLIGLACRRPVWNTFAPGLVVEATQVAVVADQAPIDGVIVVPATKYCPGGQFATTRTLRDTTVTVRARLRDAPLPITVLDWQIEIGNFSVNSIGNWHMIDPRPSWSNEPAKITTSSLVLIGKVNHPDPPLVAISGPFAIGHLYPRDDLPVTVTGDPEGGWRLSFRAADGNFYVRMAADVVDGDGVQWHGETFVHVQGDALSLPPDYHQYLIDCAAMSPPWWELAGRLVAVGKVEPGQPVSRQSREATVIRTLVAARDVDALSHLITAASQFGAGVLNRVGAVTALPITVVDAPQVRGAFM